jgi:hypothetical protein
VLMHDRAGALDPDLVLYQRTLLGLSTDELRDEWAQLIGSLSLPT